MTDARTTTDHHEIRQWVEERNGKPASVPGTSKGGKDVGLVRIDFAEEHCRRDVADHEVRKAECDLIGNSPDAMTGFVVRTFSNGTLHCSAGTCLGNYGGAYPLDYRRVIQPAS